MGRTKSGVSTEQHHQYRQLSCSRGREEAQEKGDQDQHVPLYCWLQAAIAYLDYMPLLQEKRTDKMRVRSR